MKDLLNIHRNNYHRRENIQQKHSTTLYISFERKDMKEKKEKIYSIEI